MKRSEIAKTISQIISNTDDYNDVEQDLLNYLKDYSSVVKIQFPTLDENLRPKMERVGECPNNKTCNCNDCPRFLGYINISGELFSFNIYNGICLNEDIELDD